ncbi:DUF262 domain-containing protein [Aliivibrio sifiae]|uniref:GmrSD restriction endonucleases N-terminal domain-containing protein n=1 Tax=Aliivibrio sifiae TaxID=566293 RepID=A0A2S7X8P2_9GAMM|nr:DUF262 domain-containing protein [Aliivibrio sifiae]PQJ87505.1 hypothetical protein BTO23_15475 [Aliivibrio sifiae]GLR77137.1 hypothetical protein GCM10007855_40120 [Aliivibrio sifiae]
MNLLEQIEEKRKEIFTDSYPMSIGELVNLYKDGDLEINPAFQRFFRWSETQKVRLIESILLGIPLPSIFVAQREDGVWDLVDGLQRVSTILFFMNELKNEEGKIDGSLKLTATEYLPLLEGVIWKGESNELDSSLKRLFKREKIEIKIIKKESDTSTKFELFQRLNTGGSQLSDQEVRNCLLIMLNEDFYKILVDLSKDQNFNETISITERLYEERYEMELILRLLSLANTQEGELKNIPDVSDFLTNKLKSFADSDIDWKHEKELLAKTFRILNATLSDNAFKRKVGDQFKGGFQLTIFEVIATGTYLFLKNRKDEAALPDLLRNVCNDLSSNETFNRYSGSGSKANYRWPKFVPLAMSLFVDED